MALDDRLAREHEPLLGDKDDERKTGDVEAPAPRRRGILAQGSVFITDTSASQGVSIRILLAE